MTTVTVRTRDIDVSIEVEADADVSVRVGPAPYTEGEILHSLLEACEVAPEKGWQLIRMAQDRGGSDAYHAYLDRLYSYTYDHKALKNLARRLLGRTG